VLRADKAANFAKIERFAAEAAESGARLVLFPECCITGYWFMRNLSTDQLAALARTSAGGASTQRLSALAQRLGMSIWRGSG
jgi:predicted amidohydrolase